MVVCQDIFRTVPVGQSGTTVIFDTCTATDDSGNPPTLVSYQPPSGTEFSVGTSPVQAVFIDGAGNAGVGTFNVVIEGMYVS